MFSVKPRTCRPPAIGNLDTYSPISIFPSHAAAAAMACPLIEAIQPPISTVPSPPSMRRYTLNVFVMFGTSFSMG